MEFVLKTHTGHLGRELYEKSQFGISNLLLKLAGIFRMMET